MSPVLIVLVVAVVLLVAVYLFGLSPQPARGRRPTPGLLRRRSKWRRLLPVVPLLGAVGCLALAFTGFSFNVRETAPTIVLAMDVSDSMDATDVAPNRLAAAKSAAIAFLDELPEDFRVGLATFAGGADLAVAPTDDREEVIDALDALTTTRGTVIGDGLTVALDAIEEIRAQSEDVPAAVLLLSDGRDSGSSVTPGEAADRAAELSVPVFTVVVGQIGGTDGPGANLEALRAIANASGGDTFTAGSAERLRSVYQELGSQLSVELEAEPSTTPLVIGAIALTVLAGIMFVLSPR